MDCFFDQISQCTAGVSATNRTARPPRPEQGQLPYPPRRFLPVWAAALRGMRSSGAHRPRTVRPPRPRPGQARPHRRGIRQRPFACHRFFQSTRETATHRRKACRPYISAGTTCLRVRRKSFCWPLNTQGRVL